MTTLGHDFLEHCEAIRPFALRAWGQRPLGRRTDHGPVLAATQASGQADYATGDDFRYVDWNRAARLDELVTRQYRGVETGTVELLLDRSASMSIGSPTKFEMAQQLAAALGYFALAAGRSVRVPGDAVVSRPSFTGRRDAPELLGTLQTVSPNGEPLPKKVTRVARRLRRGDLTVVLSDLLDPGALEAIIAQFARPAEQLLIVQVLAAEDLDPIWLGRVRLCDVESGSGFAAELFDEDLATYRAVAAEFCRDVRRFCHVRGVTLVQLRTDAGFDRCLENLIEATAAQGKQEARMTKPE
jgi:uncharacterized protein (DUF58 family)